MTPTLSKAARALFDIDPPHPGAEWADLNSFEREDYAERVIAVLKAIREPDEAMQFAGMAQVKECTDNWQASAACAAGHAWTAMIDSILGDER